MSRDPFRGPVPDGLVYDPDHDMWVKREGEELIIGATSYGIHLAGKIIGFTAKPGGAHVERGRSLGTVECAKTIIAVHSPASFRLLAGNEALEENPGVLNRDPYDAGWMVRGVPLDWTNDQTRLIDADAYRKHILRCEPDAQFT